MSVVKPKCFLQDNLDPFQKGLLGCTVTDSIWKDVASRNQAPPRNCENSLSIYPVDWWRWLYYLSPAWILLIICSHFLVRTNRVKLNAFPKDGTCSGLGYGKQILRCWSIKRVYNVRSYVLNYCATLVSINIFSNTINFLFHGWEMQTFAITQLNYLL